MTNTLPKMQNQLLNKLMNCNEGADLVRVSCPDEESTKALKEILNMSSIQSLQIFIFITKEH